jgi:hypothetical protein
LVKIGDRQYFYDTVISPETATDLEHYTIENFNTIFKILTKSTEEISYEEIDVIP